MDRPTVRRELPLLLELSGLCGLAIALPALDVLGHSPDFLVLERLDAADLVFLAAMVALAPPLALAAAGAVAGLAGPRARRAAHLAMVAGLLAALSVQVGRHLTPLRGLPLAVAAALAAGPGPPCTAGCRRWPGCCGWPARRRCWPPACSCSPPRPRPWSCPTATTRSPARPGGRPAAGRPPIVVVAFDELPLTSLLDTGGRVDPATYPSFAWLAGRSTWYRNATAVTQWTRDAFPAMLTGRYPSRALPPHHRSYPDNLFTLLDGAYRLDVHETSTMLCPRRRCQAGAQAAAAGRPAGAGPWRALRRSGALVAELVSPWEREQQITAQFEQPVVPTTAPPGHSGTAATRPAGFAEFREGLTPDPPGDHPGGPPDPPTHRRPPRGCTTCTCSCPTARGGRCRPACATPSRPAPSAWPPGEPPGGTSRPGPGWPPSATASSWPGPTGCSARCWPACGPAACTTGPWWWSPPTTASASSRAPTRG